MYYLVHVLVSLLSGHQEENDYISGCHPQCSGCSRIRTVDSSICGTPSSRGTIGRMDIVIVTNEMSRGLGRFLSDLPKCLNCNIRRTNICQLLHLQKRSVRLCDAFQRSE